MKETLAGIGVFLAIIGTTVIYSTVINGNVAESDSTGWETDTSSDKPQSFYEDDYVDSEYVENRGTSECTEDCGGHSAGYDWASENDVCDEDFDGGNSESFAEGVREYAIENC